MRFLNKTFKFLKLYGIGICNSTDEFTLGYKSSDKQVQFHGMVNSGEKEFQKTNRWVTTQ